MLLKLLAIVLDTFETAVLGILSSKSLTSAVGDISSLDEHSCPVWQSVVCKMGGLQWSCLFDVNRMF